jgi:6-phospho-beta-glucosidase
MSRVYKLVVLGGSGAFTPELAYALTTWLLERPPLHLVLHGRDEGKLERVAAACRKVLAHTDPPVVVQTETDAARALNGADIVVNQVRVGGLAARAFDETFPHSCGLPGDETIGAGGFACALRTVPVVWQQAQQIKAYAPQAILVNLTNPASLIGQVYARAGLRGAIGVCDAPVILTNAVAGLLGRKREELSFTYAGINHIGWLLGVGDHGQDLLPLAIERIANWPRNEVDPEIIRAQHAIPSPYLRFRYSPERVLAAQQGTRPRADVLQDVERGLLEEYGRPEGEGRPQALQQRGAIWYTEVMVPAIAAVLRDTGSVQVVNLTNEGFWPWLPPDTTVEVPAAIGRHGARPLAVDLPQPDLRALLIELATYEGLVLDAIFAGSRDLALRALLCNPFISTAAQAQAVLAAAWPGGYPRPV